MLLSFNAFGDTFVNNVLPPKQSYSKVYYYGDIVMDNLVIDETELSDAELISNFSNTEPSAYGTDSVLVASFDSSLEAGSLITTLPQPLTKFIIRRQEEGSSLNPILTEISSTLEVSTYTDYYPKNNVNYTYTVSPFFEDETDKIEGRGIEGSDFVSFFGWTLSSIEATPTTYKFDLEVSSNNIQTITDYKLYENYTKYPAFRFGEMEYRKGGLSTIPYTYTESTDTYAIDLTTLNNIKAFINDKNEKILRNTNGEEFKVITYGFNYKYFDETPDQIYTISFEFSETGAV